MDFSQFFLLISLNIRVKRAFARSSIAVERTDQLQKHVVLQLFIQAVCVLESQYHLNDVCETDLQRCIDAVTPLFHFHVFQNVHDAQSVEYVEHEVESRPFGSGAAYFLTESCEFQRFRLFTEPGEAAIAKIALREPDYVMLLHILEVHAVAEISGQITEKTVEIRAHPHPEFRYCPF